MFIGILFFIIVYPYATAALLKIDIEINLWYISLEKRHKTVLQHIDHVSLKLSNCGFTKLTRLLPTILSIDIVANIASPQTSVGVSVTGAQM